MVVTPLLRSLRVEAAASDSLSATRKAFARGEAVNLEASKKRVTAASVAVAKIMRKMMREEQAA